MEVSKLTSRSQLDNTASISNKKAEKDFSREFGSASKRERDHQLGVLLENIKKKRKRIIDTNSISAVHEYKSTIKEYLSLVLKDAYRVERLRSTYNGNPSTLVEIINDELDKLTQTVLVQEKDTIAIVSRLECIEGLLIDTYK